MHRVAFHARDVFRVVGPVGGQLQLGALLPVRSPVLPVRPRDEPRLQPDVVLGDLAVIVRDVVTDVVDAGEVNSIPDGAHAILVPGHLARAERHRHHRRVVVVAPATHLELVERRHAPGVHDALRLTGARDVLAARPVALLARHVEVLVVVSDDVSPGVEGERHADVVARRALLREGLAAMRPGALKRTVRRESRSTLDDIARRILLAPRLVDLDGEHDPVSRLFRRGIVRPPLRRRNVRERREEPLLVDAGVLELGRGTRGDVAIALAPVRPESGRHHHSSSPCSRSRSRSSCRRVSRT